MLYQYKWGKTPYPALQNMSVVYFILVFIKNNLYTRKLYSKYNTIALFFFLQIQIRIRFGIANLINIHLKEQESKFNCPLIQSITSMFRKDLIKILKKFKIFFLE